jgi:hypothetical protein
MPNVALGSRIQRSKEEALGIEASRSSTATATTPADSRAPDPEGSRAPLHHARQSIVGGANQYASGVGTPGPGAPLPGGRHPADLARNAGVITSTLLSGVIAVAVTAEWTGSDEALHSDGPVMEPGRAAGRRRGAALVRPGATPAAAAPASALPALTLDDRAGLR